MLLSPIVLATWINVCLPVADPVLAHALVAAGSGGDPLTVMDAGGQKLPGSKEVELAAALKVAPSEQEFYVGLVQIPYSSLKKLGIPADAALDPCMNLQIGYQLYSEAKEFAATVEKTPKKLLGVSFNYYRSRQKSVDGPYAIKAMGAIDKPALSPPAPFGSRLYMTISVQAAASSAKQLAARSIGMIQSGAQMSRLAVMRLNNR